MATAGGLYYQNKAANEQKKYYKSQQKQGELQQALARRDEIRKARLARATAAISAEGQGVADSSGAQGGQGSIVSQGNSNLSFLDQMGRLSDQGSRALGRATTFGNYSQIFSGVANLAVTAASFAGSPVKADDAVKTGSTGAATGSWGKLAGR